MQSIFEPEGGTSRVFNPFAMIGRAMGMPSTSERLAAEQRSRDDAAASATNKIVAQSLQELGALTESEGDPRRAWMKFIQGPTGQGLISKRYGGGALQEVGKQFVEMMTPKPHNVPPGNVAIDPLNPSKPMAANPTSEQQVLNQVLSMAQYTPGEQRELGRILALPQDQRAGPLERHIKSMVAAKRITPQEADNLLTIGLADKDAFLKIVDDVDVTGAKTGRKFIYDVRTNTLSAMQPPVVPGTPSVAQPTSGATAGQPQPQGTQPSPAQPQPVPGQTNVQTGRNPDGRPTADMFLASGAAAALERGVAAIVQQINPSAMTDRAQAQATRKSQIDMLTATLGDIAAGSRSFGHSEADAQRWITLAQQSGKLSSDPATALTFAIGLNDFIQSEKMAAARVRDDQSGKVPAETKKKAVEYMTAMERIERVLPPGDQMVAMRDAVRSGSQGTGIVEAGKSAIGTLQNAGNQIRTDLTGTPAQAAPGNPRATPAQPAVQPKQPSAKTPADETAALQQVGQMTLEQLMKAPETFPDASPTLRAAMRARYEAIVNVGKKPAPSSARR